MGQLRIIEGVESRRPGRNRLEKGGKDSPLEGERSQLIGVFREKDKKRPPQDKPPRRPENDPGMEGKAAAPAEKGRKIHENKETQPSQHDEEHEDYIDPHIVLITHKVVREEGKPSVAERRDRVKNREIDRAFQGILPHKQEGQPQGAQGLHPKGKKKNRPEHPGKVLEGGMAEAVMDHHTSLKGNPLAQKNYEENRKGHDP